MQRELSRRLEAELQAERDAHEATLKDAEATLLELEGIRGGGASQISSAQSLQAELDRERDAREQAEVCAMPYLALFWDTGLFVINSKV